MTQPPESSLLSSWVQKLSEPPRKLALALGVIILPAFIGIAVIFLQVLAAESRANEDYMISATRDTLTLTAYRESLRLFYVAQEAYAQPERRDTLLAVFLPIADRFDSTRSSYLLLLSRSNALKRDELMEKFGLVSAHYDILVQRSRNVFRRTEKHFEDEAPSTSKELGAGTAGGTFMPRVNEFLKELRVRFDDHLRVELEENVDQVEASGRLILKSVEQTFIISLVLFAVGAIVAFAMMRQERQSKEGTRRFQSLLEYSINPIQVVNAAGRTLYANPAYENWAGRPLKELIGNPAFEGVTLLNGTPGEKDFWSLVERTLRLGKAWSGDVEIARRVDESIYTLLIISPVMDKSGKLLECISIHHDVTERRELARKFEESQEKYQNIVESSLDGIVIVQDGRLVFVNSSAMKIFGYSSIEEMKSVSFTETVAPASRFFVLEGYQGRLIGEDILRNFELKGLSKQGKVIDLEVNAKLVSWNGRPAVQASFRDITERKLLEREQALWLWEQETMSTIDRQLVSSVNLQVVLDTISHHAKILTRADWAGVMLADLASQLVRWRAVKGNQVPLPQEPFRLGAFYKEIVGSKEPIVMQDLGTNPKFLIDEFPLFKEEHIVSAARFPLVVDKEIRGQLVVGYRQHHEFSSRELRLLSSLAEKSSIALANAQLYDNLLSRERDLEALSGARVKAQEEERRRIAREIHDSLGQILTAIKFNVEILEDGANFQNPEDLQRIADIKGLLDSSMAEAREISYNLMPSVLVDFGLVPALQLLCEQFSNRNNLKVNFHTSGVDSRLDPIVEVGLYRIAQEALNNIAKHAEATEVNAQLIGDDRTLRLTIDDDGKGFRVRSFELYRNDRHGMGLVSMRERAISFNGSFALDSRPGKGTEIIVEVPMIRKEAHG